MNLVKYRKKAKTRNMKAAKTRNPRASEAALSPAPAVSVLRLPASCKTTSIRSQVGIYAVLDPGQQFLVLVTALHEDESVRNTVGDSADVILARLRVDGKDTNDVDILFSDIEWDEHVIDGFTESSELSACGDERRSTNRLFVFFKARTTAQGVAGKAVPNDGQIRMNFESAKYGRIRDHSPKRKAPKKATPEKVPKAKPTGPRVVHEETAAKLGLSVGVTRDGEEQEANHFVSPYRFRKRKKLPKNIVIFVRERYWLESRRIIDLEGKAYHPPERPPPTVDPVPVPLDDDDGKEAGGEHEEVKKEPKKEGQIFAPGEVIELDLE